MPRPSITDVAKLAKVSTATVSRVLNQNGAVKPHLQDRVMLAMEELRYEPSAIARNMRNQSKQTIGFVISDIRNPFFTNMVSAIEETAYGLHYTVLLGSSNNQEEKERLFLEVLAKERVAGIIVVPTSYTAAIYEFRRPMPMVFVDRMVSGVKADAVMLDNHLGGYAAGRHLAELGHERVALVAAPATDAPTVEREQGFAQALREAGIPAPNLLSSWGNRPREEGGYRATLELLSQHPRPTAIFAVNNVRTLGMLRAIHEMGLRIPDELSVVGFDDSPWLSLLSPPLTTVSQPIYEMGEEAVRLVMQRIALGVDSPGVVTRMTPTLIERASTRALR